MGWRFTSFTFCSDAQFSAPVTAVSYAPPTLTSISGDECINTSPETVINCPRRVTGGTLLLVGQEFGLLGARVFVGAKECTNAQHVEDFEDERVCIEIRRAHSMNQPLQVRC